MVDSLLRSNFDGVNIINSIVVAKNKSIQISQIRHEKNSEYQSCVTLTVVTDKQKRSVSATLFGGKPRIVNVKGIKIEAELLKYNLFHYLLSNLPYPNFYLYLFQF